MVERLDTEAGRASLRPSNEDVRRDDESWQEAARNLSQMIDTCWQKF